MQGVPLRRLVTTRLSSLISSGSLRADPAQVSAAGAFDAAASRIAAFSRARAKAIESILFEETRARVSAEVVSVKNPASPLSAPPLPPLVPRDVAAVGALPRGLYVYGPVGSGKSLLADLFCDDAAATHKLRVRRQHFHAFLLGIHERVRTIRLASTSAKAGAVHHINQSPECDAFSRSGAELAASADVFVLDELQVTDVADALILARVFRALLSAGAALVVTSNRPAVDLYAGGLNREYFLPTIAALETHCVTLNMASVACDYRVAMAVPRVGRLCIGLGAPAQLAAALAAFTKTDCATSSVTVTTLPLAFGRSLNVRTLAPGVAVCDFVDLCARPLGAADYGALAQSFHIVALRNVPRFTRATHNEARRFITLVDELYEARCVIFLEAQTAPNDLFTKLTLGGGGPKQQHHQQQQHPKRGGPFFNEPLGAEPAGGGGADYDAVDEGTDAVNDGDDDDDDDSINDAAKGNGVALGCFAPHEGGAGNKIMPRVMTVVSAAETAALGELRFACARAVSRLIEMTSEGFEGEVTKAVRIRNRGGEGRGGERSVSVSVSEANRGAK